jgi:hypothetical protein
MKNVKNIKLNKREKELIREALCDRAKEIVDAINIDGFYPGHAEELDEVIKLLTKLNEPLE